MGLTKGMGVLAILAMLVFGLGTASANGLHGVHHGPLPLRVIVDVDARIAAACGQRPLQC